MFSSLSDVQGNGLPPKKGTSIFRTYKIEECAVIRLMFVDDGRELNPGDYVFVQGENYKDHNHPWIGRVVSGVPATQVYPVDRVRVRWTYHPFMLNPRPKVRFGPKELVMSNHFDMVDKSTLMGRAAVVEGCRDCRSTSSHWCWNKAWNVFSKRLDDEILEKFPWL